MEKLNNRLLTTAVAAILAAFTTSAIAGPGFRLSSKSPVYQQPKKHKAYFFGYGGFDSGSYLDTTGAFDLDQNWQDNCPPGHDGHYGFDPTQIPINMDFDNGFTLGGGVGVYSGLLGGSRFEIEGFSTQNDSGYLEYAGFELPADFELRTLAIMFNMLKEVPLGETGAKAYFGGGVGYATTTFEGDLDTILYDNENAGFAWQLIAGVDFPVTESFSIFTQYAFRVLSEQHFVTDFGDFTQTTDENPYSHAVMVGGRVSF
ncbi:MAG: outer membrane beta-barrel protein [Verrucomicrobiales bacterium]|nr:outer membrane beta-barrel protein [Verrucomicrobiales bacterium]